MNLRNILLMVAVLIAGVSACVVAQDVEVKAGGMFTETASLVEAKAIASHTEVSPGQVFHVALDVKIAKDYGYYSPDPRGASDVQVLPAELTVEAGEPLTVLSALWPMDKITLLVLISSFSLTINA